jgi:hypothetical protein
MISLLLICLAQYRTTSTSKNTASEAIAASHGKVGSTPIAKAQRFQIAITGPCLVCVWQRKHNNTSRSESQ